MGFISPVATDSNGNPKITGGTQSLGKDDFLELLVTKLQYQDPLNPMDDEDFVAQLAQFSSLEQMSNIADGIETSNQWDFLQMQSLNNVLASGLIGKEVKADFSGVYLDDSNEPSIGFELPEFAEDLKIEIYNDEEILVRTITKKDLEDGSHKITWDGKDTKGNRADEGYYTIKVTATAPDGDDIEPELSLIGVVSKVVYRDGAAYLTVNGTEVAMGDISSISEPTEEEE